MDTHWKTRCRGVTLRGTLSLVMVVVFLAEFAFVVFRILEKEHRTSTAIQMNEYLITGFIMQSEPYVQDPEAGKKQDALRLFSAYLEDNNKLGLAEASLGNVQDYVVHRMGKLPNNGIDGGPEVDAIMAEKPFLLSFLDFRDASKAAAAAEGAPRPAAEVAAAAPAAPSDSATQPLIVTTPLSTVAADVGNVPDFTGNIGNLNTLLVSPLDANAPLGNVAAGTSEGPNRIESVPIPADGMATTALLVGDANSPARPAAAVAEAPRPSWFARGKKSAGAALARTYDHGKGFVGSFRESLKNPEMIIALALFVIAVFAVFSLRRMRMGIALLRVEQDSISSAVSRIGSPPSFGSIPGFAQVPSDISDIRSRLRIISDWMQNINQSLARVTSGQSQSSSVMSSLIGDLQTAITELPNVLGSSNPDDDSEPTRVDQATTDVSEILGRLTTELGTISQKLVAIQRQQSSLMPAAGAGMGRGSGGMGSQGAQPQDSTVLAQIADLRQTVETLALFVRMAMPRGIINEKVVALIEADDGRRIQELFDQSILLTPDNVNDPVNAKGETALYIAMANCRLDAARVLLDNGADINAECSADGKTPYDAMLARLAQAASDDDDDILSSFWNFGNVWENIDDDVPFPDGSKGETTLAAIAASTGSIHVLCWLIEKSNLESFMHERDDGTGMSPVQLLLRHISGLPVEDGGAVDMLKSCIGGGILDIEDLRRTEFPSADGSQKVTLLSESVRTGNPGLVSFLAGKGLDASGLATLLEVSSGVATTNAGSDADAARLLARYREVSQIIGRAATKPARTAVSMSVTT